MQVKTPFYHDTHRRFRARVRAFVEAEIMPHVDEWEEECNRGNSELPLELLRKAYLAGVYVA